MSCIYPLVNIFPNILDKELIKREELVSREFLITCKRKILCEMNDTDILLFKGISLYYNNPVELDILYKLGKCNDYDDSIKIKMLTYTTKLFQHLNINNANNSINEALDTIVSITTDQLG